MRRTTSAFLLAVALLGVSMAAACSRGESVAIPYNVDGSGGQDTFDAGTDASDDATPDGPISQLPDAPCDLSCEGECLPFHPEGFSEPFLVWVGNDPATAPDCPATAPVERPLRYGDPTTPPASCNECSCGESYGFCELPTAFWTQAAPCNAPAGAPTLPTDAPAAWDGSCTNENPIAAGLSCGAGNPCVQAVWADPIAITDEACAPQGTSTTDLPLPTWGFVTKACEGSAFGSCSPNEHCVPALVDGFKQCVQRDGIHDCTNENYPVQMVVYEDFLDNRSCSPCSCGKPQSSDCLASIDFFSDANCGTSIASGNLWSQSPACRDVIPTGSAIGSKQAGKPVYIAGTCEASGGELLGNIEWIGARTYCCQA